VRSSQGGECYRRMFSNFLQKPESGFLPAFGTKEFLLTLNELSFIATELHQTFGPLFNPAITADAETAQLEKLATKIKRLDAELAARASSWCRQVRRGGASVRQRRRTVAFDRAAKGAGG